MSEPEPKPGNNEPHAVHNAEQMWAQAEEQLRKVMAYAESVMPSVYANAGGNTDISVVYDWWKAYIQLAEEQGQHVAALFNMDHNGAHDMTIIMCAAAITRLMRNDDRMATSTVLAQFEREILNDDDH